MFLNSKRATICATILHEACLPFRSMQTHYVPELQQRLNLAFRSLFVANSKMRLHPEKGANDHSAFVSLGKCPEF